MGLTLMKQLWKSFVVESLIRAESDVFFQWFIQILDPKSKVEIKVEINDLIEFYNEKFECFQWEIVSKEAFKCFKEMFCIINES